MSYRVRYVPAAPDTNAVLTSTQNFKSESGIFYKVYLNMMDSTFEIRQVGNNEAVVSGKAKNSAQLRANAKKALSTLGVTFTNETRTKSIQEANEEVA